MREKPLKIVIFTYSGEASGIAIRLKEEGYPVTVAQIQDYEDILTKVEKKGKKEDPEERRTRLSLLDGMVQKTTADEAVKRLLAVPQEERKDWFLFADMNHCFKPMEQLRNQGFPGLFPTEKLRIAEVDRSSTKDFVEKNYPDLEVAPVFEFKKIEEADELLDKAEALYVIKSNDEDGETYVPTATDPKIGAEEIKDQLKNGKALYEKSGFILEEMIPNGIELTPEMVWYDGKPLYATMDVELKRKFSGNVGKLCGCAADLVFPIPIDSEIMRMSIPPAIHKLAKEHGGLFVYDAAVLFSEDGIPYYLESCSLRKGWNATYTELAMMPSVGHWFECLAEGVNPFDERIADFGASIRIFNENDPKEDVPFYGNLSGDGIWLMDAKKKGKIVSSGYGRDLAVITGAGDEPKQALYNAAQNLKNIVFKKMVYRPYHDLVDKTYPGNILERYMYGVSEGLYPGDERPTILIDFDLVLADENEELIEGSEAVLTELASKGFRLSVFTARSDHEYIRDWLDENLPFIPISDISSTKEPSAFYVDDNAIRFKDWKQVLSDIWREKTFEIEETSVPEKQIEEDSDTTETVMDLEEDVRPLQRKRTNKWDDYREPDAGPWIGTEDSRRED